MWNFNGHSMRRRWSSLYILKECAVTKQKVMYIRSESPPYYNQSWSYRSKDQTCITAVMEHYLRQGSRLKEIQDVAVIGSWASVCTRPRVKRALASFHSLNLHFILDSPKTGNSYQRT